MEELSAYEVERAANIRMNQQRLALLGLQNHHGWEWSKARQSPKRRKVSSIPQDVVGFRRSTRSRTPVLRFGDLLPDEHAQSQMVQLKSSKGRSPLLDLPANPHTALLISAGVRFSPVNAHLWLGIHSRDEARAENLRSMKTSFALEDRPSPESNSTRATEVPVSQVVATFLGKHMDGPPTKHTVVSLLAGRSNPRFSKYSGSLEWANAVVLWVNVGGQDYNNVFLDSGARMTWFASPRHTSDSFIVQRLVRTAGGSTESEANSAFDSVLLFCRLPGAPYVCCGRLSYESHDPRMHPIKFVWKLDDFKTLRQSELFKELLAIK